MIGVIATSSERSVVEEFFQLFKTPWETWRPGRFYDVVIATTPVVPEINTRLLVVYNSRTTNIDLMHGIIAERTVRCASLAFDGGSLPTYGETVILAADSGSSCVSTEYGSAGLRLQASNRQVLRLGYDLFQEIQYLLQVGQPADKAQFPTIEIHIAMLREWIINANISLVEIPPSPSAFKFIVCLTHDIDFAGIRQHKFDHTMWGFLYRAILGSLRNFARRRLSFRRLLESWRSAVSLPFVYLGLAKDFWLPFEWYLEVEKGIPATYFLIPFKGRQGENLSVNQPSRRRCAYDIGDIPEWTTKLLREGNEIGVHGIDAWHSAISGKEELARIEAVSSNPDVGIRMHWLLRDERTYRTLEDAGYSYDSTNGFNETAGYRNGTVQAFRPLDCLTLLELPLHIQDGAMFFPNRLDLSEQAAWKLCESFIATSMRFGGVFTLLWHDRSHAPERFWGDFYALLVQKLVSMDVWFGTAAQVVAWFRKRREVSFLRVEGASQGYALRVVSVGGKVSPPLTIRVHRPADLSSDQNAESKVSRRFVDVCWSGELDLDLGSLRDTECGAFSPSRPVNE